jgi:hypothetical protein
MSTEQLSEAKRLHRKGESRMPSGHLYSMLDLMGATVTCDRCGNWQRLPILIPEDALDAMKQLGWNVCDGRDICPECKPAERAP